MDRINHLDVPEVSGYTVRDAIVSYAVRAPGASRWIGHICHDGACTVTPATFHDPAIAAARARALLDAPASPTPAGDVTVDALSLGQR